LTVRATKESIFTKNVWEANCSEIRCSTNPAITCQKNIIISVLMQNRLDFKWIGIYRIYNITKDVASDELEKITKSYYIYMGI